MYEVEFYNSNKEYDYDIDVSTGAILSYGYDAEHYTKPTPEPTPTLTPGTNYIGADVAKTIALNHAGLSASDVSFSKVKLEDDGGHKAYEVEFYYNDMENEYSIDAVSGNIVDYDRDRAD